MSQGTLIAFELLAAVAAIGILFVRAVIHAAMLLLVCLLSVAGIFALLGAEFLFVSQIMVYAGGVLVLLIMGIMVTSHQARSEIHSTAFFPTAVMGTAFFVFIISALSAFRSLPPLADGPSGTAPAIGKLLISSYVLPFELAAVLLLVALVGSAIVAADKPPRT
ncbi:MAG: NADH-quinone oxidoreductase subunit J [Cyclobacteriaceae bacterium]|nr:NADH-quinone oxidoreductase subunit J [Cyclobacteriaceae bacterium]